MKNPEIPLLIAIGVISLIFAFCLTSDINQARDTLRGVAYEGLILVGVVGIFLAINNKRTEDKISSLNKKERIKSRDSLLSVLSLLCEAFHTGGIFHWTKHASSAAPFEKNFNKFKLAKENTKSALSENLGAKYFKNSCEHNVQACYALIPVAEGISVEHLNAWIGICSLMALMASDGMDQSMILDEFESFAGEFASAGIK